MFLEGLCYQLSGAQKNPDGGLRSCKVYCFSLLGLIILCYDCSFALAFFFSQECPLGPNMLEVRSWELRGWRLLKHCGF